MFNRYGKDDAIEEEATFFVDRWLVFSFLLLVAYGVLMVASASMMISSQQFSYPFHYLYRQIAYLIVGLVAMVVMCNVPFKTIARFSPIALLLGIGSLCLVLIPGIGHVVNGSRRWISIGFLSVQVSEFVKLFFILYLAQYLQRYQTQIRKSWWGFIKPCIVLFIICGLLLLQPDFGTAVVIALTCFILLFISGSRLSIFVCLGLCMLAAAALLAFVAPYRLTRLTSFVNPWHSPFGAGYQLTQSLIAFGRGGIDGVGLGNSVQKLFYLPEAHTDFLFAVIGEELGLLGELVMIGLFVVWVVRGLQLARLAKHVHSLFASYVAFGISALIAVQAFINMGVNIGLLPTKGLTLPFVSYGGSSMLVSCMMVGVMLRLSHELHQIDFKTPKRFRE